MRADGGEMIRHGQLVSTLATTTALEVAFSTHTEPPARWPEPRLPSLRIVGRTATADPEWAARPFILVGRNKMASEKTDTIIPARTNILKDNSLLKFLFIDWICNPIIHL
jgi:hypothetical protein